MGYPDDIPDRRGSDVLHKLVLDRLNSIEAGAIQHREAIERKLDSTFEDLSERVVVVETDVKTLKQWRDLQQLAADLKEKRRAAWRSRLAGARVWIGFAVGTGVGVVSVLAATHQL